MTLDLSLANAQLYAGLQVQRVAGKLTLLDPPAVAVEVLGKNLEAVPVDPDEVTLTGAMAIWAYLVAFHFLHGRTRRILYQDGRGERVLVAAHG